MLRFVSLLVLAISLNGCQEPSDADITTFILVRHAEKIITDDKNPDLTTEGYQRAEKLKEVLSEVQIDEIYSSDYKRTIATVNPIAEERGLTINRYNPGELFDFSQSLIEKHTGSTVLISGHSNTTPRLINQFIGEDQLNDLTEKEYDWLYIVDFISTGNLKVKKLKITL